MYLVTFRHWVWWLFILSYFKYLALQKVTGVSDHKFWLWVQVIGIKKGFLDSLPDKKLKKKTNPSIATSSPR